MKATINLSTKHPVLPQFPQYGICILESRHSSGFHMAPSQYAFSEVMLILDGKGWVLCEEDQYPVERGNLIVVPSGVTYSYTDSQGAPLAVLCLCLGPSVDLAAVITPMLPKRFQCH